MIDIDKDIILNQNIHNKIKTKPIKCNIIKEIFKARDKVLEVLDEDDLDEYYEYYEEYFENWDKNNYSLGECISFLEIYGEEANVIDIDVKIYSCEHYLSENMKYNGICKLPNGADIIVFFNYSEECAINICQVVYFDGEKLKMFTPFEGNAVNIITMTAIGNEYYTMLSDEELRNKEYFKEIYPNNLISIKDYYFQDEATKGYLKWLIKEKLDEKTIDCIYSDIMGNGIYLDYEKICNEIELILN